MRADDAAASVEGVTGCSPRVVAVVVAVSSAAAATTAAAVVVVFVRTPVHILPPPARPPPPRDGQFLFLITPGESAADVMVNRLCESFFYLFFLKTSVLKISPSPVAVCSGGCVRKSVSSAKIKKFKMPTTGFSKKVHPLGHSVLLRVVRGRPGGVQRGLFTAVRM